MSERRRIPTGAELDEVVPRGNIVNRFKSVIARLRVRPGVGESRRTLTDRASSTLSDPATSGPEGTLGGHSSAVQTRPIPAPAPPETRLRQAASPTREATTSHVGSPSTRLVKLAPTVKTSRGQYRGPSPEGVQRARAALPADHAKSSEHTAQPERHQLLEPHPHPPPSAQGDRVDVIIAGVIATGAQLPARFSCNSQGQVWSTREGGRVYYQGRSAVLDALVHEFLRRSPDGGRFTVTSEGVYVDRSGEWLVRRHRQSSDSF